MTINLQVPFFAFAITIKCLRIYFTTMGFTLRQQVFLLINNRQRKERFKWEIVRCSNGLLATACCSLNGTCGVVDYKMVPKLLIPRVRASKKRETLRDHRE